MSSGTFMVPVTINEEQKTYISNKYPGKELTDALKIFITECIDQSLKKENPFPKTEEESKETNFK